MATSSMQLIPYVLANLRQAPLSSLLDVGIGFGNYGYLVRSYYDLAKAVTPDEFKREKWRMRIDGIEGFAPFVDERLKCIYDNIYLGPMDKVLATLGSYDVIIIIAVLVHLPKAQGFEFLDMAYERANSMVVVTTPTRVWPQDDIFNNPYEVHQNVMWVQNDFNKYAHTAHIALPQGERITLLSRTSHVKITNPYRKDGLRRKLISVLGTENARKLSGLIRRIDIRR